jgi:hypothetical protein
MEHVTLTFTREKETKNTVRFQEDERAGQAPVIGSLYVQKYAAGASQSLTITIDGSGAKVKR